VHRQRVVGHGQAPPALLAHAGGARKACDGSTMTEQPCFVLGSCFEGRGCGVEGHLYGLWGGGVCECGWLLGMDRHHQRYWHMQVILRGV
jgi:hypothetical protein